MSIIHEKNILPQQIAARFLWYFKKYMRLSTQKEMQYVNKNKSLATGHDDRYDIYFKNNDLGTYRKIFNQFADEMVRIYGGTKHKEDRGFVGSTYHWDPESILKFLSYNFHFGRKLSNWKYKKDSSNRTYITISDYDLWDLIYSEL